jgi:hypothetical protein
MGGPQAACLPSLRIASLSLVDVIERGLMMRASLTISVLTASLGVVHGAIAAPAQLHNKTIFIRWSEQVTQKGPDGKVINRTISSERAVYVSSAGRTFVRGTRTSSSGLGEKFERSPGEGVSQGVLGFQGNQLVGTAVQTGFARRVVGSFDAGFTSCSASVVYGKSGGPTTWKGFDGVTYEVLSISVSGASCSIRDGNAFAN